MPGAPKRKLTSEKVVGTAFFFLVAEVSRPVIQIEAFLVDNDRHPKMDFLPNVLIAGRLVFIKMLALAGIAHGSVHFWRVRHAMYKSRLCLVRAVNLRNC